MTELIERQARRSNTSEVLLRDLQDAHRLLVELIGEFQHILDQPALNPAALTTARLKLASLRLTRGSLVTRVAELFATLELSDPHALSKLQSVHHQLLKKVTAHTSKWPLDKIGDDWNAYRAETGSLMREWKAKSEAEQQILYPILSGI